MKAYPLLVLLCLCAPSLFALPPSKSNQGRLAIRKDELCHTWASTDLSGDAIWLVLDKVYIDMKKDGSFKAVAKMNSGDDKHFDGSYSLGVGKIRFDASAQKITCYYTLENGTLTLKPDGHNVTVKLQKGALPQPGSGNETTPAPGMHF